MFNKKNLKKISCIVGIISVLVFMFSAFDVQWRGASIINNIPAIEFGLLNSIKDMIIEMFGLDIGNLIYNIASLNIAWYVFIVLPIWFFEFVKKVGGLND